MGCFVPTRSEMNILDEEVKAQEAELRMSSVVSKEYPEWPGSENGEQLSVV